MERKSAVDGRKSVVATVKDSKVYAFKDSESAGVRGVPELAAAYGADVVSAALTALGMRMENLQVPDGLAAKEVKLAKERQANALRDLEDKILQLAGHDQEITRWESVRRAPPQEKMRDTSTQLLRPQSAPNLGASKIRERNAATTAKFRAAADHKVMNLLDSLLTSKRQSDLGAAKKQASEARLANFRQDQAKYYANRAAEAEKGRAKVFSRIYDFEQKNEESRQEYGRQHDEHMAKVEANRLAYQKGIQDSRRQQGSAREEQVEQHYQDARRKAKQMVEKMKERSDTVEAYKEETRQNFAARKAAWQAQYQRNLRNAAAYNAKAQVKRETNHLAFDAAFTKTREHHAKQLDDTKTYFKNHNKKRFDTYSKNKGSLGNEKARTNDALFAKQEAAAERAAHIRSLGLKSGITLKDHCAQRDLWTGFQTQNHQRLKRAQSAGSERTLRVVEERMAASNAVKEEMARMKQEKQQLASKFLHMQDDFGKVFTRLKATKEPEKLASAVEKMGFQVDLTAYGFVDAPKKAAEEEVRPAF